MRKLISISIAAFLAVGIIFGLTGSVKAATNTVNLGNAGRFVILSGTGITDAPTSAITGNIGVSPTTGASITGIVQAQVTGSIYTVDAAGPTGRVEDPTLLTNAQSDLTAAYTDAAGRTPVTTIPTELGGTTRTAGVYDSAATTFGITAGAGPLVLDGQGDANAVFIFEAAAEQAGALTVGPGSTVSLINGASACNVFWRVYGATIDTTAIFKGNILALTSITVANGANIEGRLLARNGNVTLINDTITVGVCAAAYTADTATETATTDLPSTGNGMIWLYIGIAVVIAIGLIIFIVTRKKKDIQQL